MRRAASGQKARMSHHEQDPDPQRRREQEEQQYPGHSDPDEQSERVGLPREDEKRAPNERDQHR